MKFNYTHTFADYWMLNRRHLLRLKGIRVILSFSGCLFLVFLLSPFALPQPEGKSMGEIYLSSVAGLILPLIMALMFISTYFAARKRWNSAADLRCEKTYEFSETGIQIAATEMDGNIGWRYIAEAELWRGWIFIKTHQNIYYYFPLSAVPDPDALISLLIAKTPKTKGMKSI